MASSVDFSFTFPSDGSSPIDHFSATNSESISEVHNGEIAEIAEQSDIIKALECPVCREVALPPINSCESGHLICGACRRRLLSCALCKASFTNTRNYALESIIAKSKLFCAFKDYGCQEIVLGERLNDHVKVCPFRREEEEHSPPRPESESIDGSSFYIDGLRIQLNFSPSSSLLGSRLNLSFSDDDSFIQTMLWVRGRDGEIPENAVIAGHSSQGSPIYVIRAFHGNACAPGMICPAESSVAFVNWFGTKSKYYYEVLVAVPHTVRFAPCRGSDIPANAVVGADQTDFEKVYIGRSKIDNCWVAGYIKPSHRRCYVTNGQTAIGRKYYQVLVTI